MSKRFVSAEKEGSGKPIKVAIEDLIFSPSIYGIIIRDNKILLSPQWDGYDFPGGGVNVGETLDETLEREVWEETGLNVKRGAAVAVENNFFVRLSGEKFQGTLMYCLCTNVRGKVSSKNFDEDEKAYIKEAVWMPLSKVKKLKFYNGVDSPAIIKRALQLMK